MKTNLELKDKVGNLKERLRKQQKKYDNKVLKLKGSKKKLKQKLEDIQQEIIECHQQMAENKFQLEMSNMEKEQLEKRLKESVYRIQSDYSEKAVLLNAQLSSMRNQKESANQEMNRLHDLINTLTLEKRYLEENVLVSIQQVKDRLEEVDNEDHKEELGYGINHNTNLKRYKNGSDDSRNYLDRIEEENSMDTEDEDEDFNDNTNPSNSNDNDHQIVD
jgi:chromosome segregation ATPase